MEEKVEQKVGCAPQGFLPRENLRELAQQSSPDQILTCGDLLKKEDSGYWISQPLFSLPPSVSFHLSPPRPGTVRGGQFRKEQDAVSSRFCPRRLGADANGPGLF